MSQVERQYSAREGSRLTDEDATKIGMYLEREFGDKGITAEAFVEAATPEGSPLHDKLALDVKKAAHQYRLNQARNCLRSIKITVTYGGEEVRTRAYHSVVIKTKDNEKLRAYLPESIVWTHSELSEQVVNRAMVELRRWRDRYIEYNELHAEVAKVDDLLEANGY